MTSTIEETPKKSLKSKKDPSRFHPPGLNYKGKFIGIEHVADACGDRSDMMCQVAMAKMKAAIKTLGDHKKKIIINVSTDGIKILDERSEDLIFDHSLTRISYISKDISDSRAFGYVFNPSRDCHEFYGIKTEKTAEMVVSSLRELFCHYNSMSIPQLNYYSVPENEPLEVNEDLSRFKMPSPAYSLKYVGGGGDGTLSRLKKSPLLFSRFQSTTSEYLYQSNPQTAAGTNSPRKQAGFLTFYNRQSSAPLQSTPPAATGNNSTTIVSSTSRHVQPLSSTVVYKTPSLSSSSSSNQNVNSPSASALKSPLSVIASKKSLSSISSLPVVESPPPSPAVFRLPDASLSTSPKLETETPSLPDKCSQAESPGDNKPTDSTDHLSNSGDGSIKQVGEVWKNQMISWANFDEGFNEFEFSDDSPRDSTEGSKTAGLDGDSLARSNVSIPTEDNQRKSFQSTTFFHDSVEKNRQLVLSFNGVDPFVDDPFFNKSVDFVFDEVKAPDDDFIQPSSSDAADSKSGKQEFWVGFEQVVEKFENQQGCSSEVSRDSFPDEVVVQPPNYSECDRRRDETFFEDDFVPSVMNSNSREELLPDASRGKEYNGGELETADKSRPDENSLDSVRKEDDIGPSPVSSYPANIPVFFPFQSSISLRSGTKVHQFVNDDSLLASPSTDPSEFPSPDIPPPPLPPEIIPPCLTSAPPLPPRRPTPILANKSNCNPSFSLTLGRMRSDRLSASFDTKKTQKLDTASILKLYSSPPPPYLSSPSVVTSSNSFVSSSHRSSFDSEPIYGNSRSRPYCYSAGESRNTENEDFPLKSHSRSAKVTPLIPPRNGKKQSLSTSPFTSLDNPGYADVGDESEGLNQSLEISGFLTLQRPHRLKANFNAADEFHSFQSAGLQIPDSLCTDNNESR